MKSLNNRKDLTILLIVVTMIFALSISTSISDNVEYVHGVDYEIKFDNITILQDHDPNVPQIPLQPNDGEWNLIAFVNGQNVTLGGKDTPLHAARTNEVYELNYVEPIRQRLGTIGMLLIDVLGEEVDTCNWNEFPELATDAAAAGAAVANGAYQGVYEVYKEEIEDYENYSKYFCWNTGKLNENDELGRVTKEHGPPCFGEGTQRITSEKGDYVLTYTIEFKPSPTQAVRPLGCESA